MKGLAEFLRKIRKKKTLIVLHSLADADAAASGLALKRFLKNALVIPSDTVTSPAKHILGKLRLSLDTLPDEKEFDEVIALDFNSESMLAPEFPIRKFTAVIDHHSKHKDALKAPKHFIDNSYAATCELLFEALQKEKLDATTSTLLLAGILADSANFKTASSRTLKFAGELLERSGLSYSHALELVSTQPDFSQRTAVLKAGQRMQFQKIEAGKNEFLAAYSIVGSFEATAASALVELGADFAFVGCDAKEGARISARSLPAHASSVDLSQVMAEVGRKFGGSGGGHPTAAGANNLRKPELENALKNCIELVSKKVQEK